MLFKAFAGVDAFPSASTRRTRRNRRIVRAIAPVFGGINLEDIAAPRCFEIEERLRGPRHSGLPRRPARHGDGRARRAPECAQGRGQEARRRAGSCSGGAAQRDRHREAADAGGRRHIVACDRAGALYRGRTEHMNPVKSGSRSTRTRRLRGRSPTPCVGRRRFHRSVAARYRHCRTSRRMARDPIVFAMANPTPEVMPEEAGSSSRSSRPDGPTTRTRSTTSASRGSSGGALECAPGGQRGDEDRRRPGASPASSSASELPEDYIIPSVFDRRVVEAVADGVAEAAARTGVARRKRG